MRLRKIVLIGLVIVFVAIQFMRPARNTNHTVLASGIIKQYNVPLNVEVLLRTACFDCHSNNTRYPWYANVQPMGWLLADHIKDGKAKLNFDEFGNLSKRRQLSKLKSIAGSVKDGSMPIASYTWLHKDAKLLVENKASIIDWAIKTRDSLEVKN